LDSSLGDDSYKLELSELSKVGISPSKEVSGASEFSLTNVL
jgi:hypothetical protein